MPGHDYSGTKADSCFKHGDYMDGVCPGCAAERRQKQLAQDQLNRENAQREACREAAVESRRTQVNTQVQNSRRSKAGPSRAVNFWSTVFNWTLCILIGLAVLIS